MVEPAPLPLILTGVVGELEERADLACGRSGDWFQVESNQWLIKLILVAL